MLILRTLLKPLMVPASLALAGTAGASGYLATSAGIKRFSSKMLQENSTCVKVSEILSIAFTAGGALLTALGSTLRSEFLTPGHHSEHLLRMRPLPAMLIPLGITLSFVGGVFYAVYSSRAERERITHD